MGAFTSVHNHVSEPEEETQQIPECTPQPSHKHKKRILNIDPRSPSEIIMRTPIVVDRTPSQSQTPRADQTPASLKDPRSPTTDFTRTPLTLNMGNTHREGQKVSSATSVQPLVGTPVSHCSLTSESGIESADVTPILKKRIDGETPCLSSPDSAVTSELTYPVASDDSLNASECYENASFHDPPSSVPSKACDTAPLIDKNLQGLRISQESESTPLVQIENTPESSLKLRQFALGKKAETISMDSKCFRSPLSFVDNSPRYGKLVKQPTRPTPSSRSQQIDKENICH